MIPIILQAIQNHHGELWHLSQPQEIIHYLSAFNISAKFAYWADDDNIKNEHIYIYRASLKQMIEKCRAGTFMHRLLIGHRQI